MVINMSHFNT